MGKIVFSSEHLPRELGVIQRRNMWGELFRQNIADVDFGMSEAPFSAQMEHVAVASVGFARLSGSISSARLGKAGASARGEPQIGLVIPMNTSIRTELRGRDEIIKPGAAMLLSPLEAAHLSTQTLHISWLVIDFPSDAVMSGARRTEDLVGTVLRAGSEPMRMISSYANLVMAQPPSDPRLANHISRTLIDLVILTLDANGDAGEAARLGGLRTSRIHTLIGEIETRYLDPTFSIKQVAARQRVTPRYLQDLLHSTGTGFAERVLELRLQHACSLLARVGSPHRKISDIAYLSGFNDLSYFHRCFRRRFGMTPSTIRPD